MSAPGRAPEMVLTDSEATLRQVEGALSDFDEQDAADHVERVINDLGSHPEGLRELVGVLVRTYTEIMEVIDSLRESRGLLEEAAMERLKITHEKLAEVSTATEMAATGMLDGLDRALALLDDIEASSGEPSEKSEDCRNQLRDELHQMMNLLQFQDITSQQLGYATGVLLDIEGRMLRLVEAFDLKDMGLKALAGVFREDGGPTGAYVPGAACDPNASTLDADERQAVADEIFPS